MKWPANKPCICTSGRKTKGCCGPILAGTLATNPESLMRSRYAAYALSKPEHIMRTTHPDGPHFRADPKAWTKEILNFCKSVRFDGLDVNESRQEDVQGSVEFTAHLSAGNTDHSFTEQSIFFRVDGAWLYHSGTHITDKST
jgi:SEC-C motif domain protein